ncbi:leucine-rich repeat-containing protein 20 isoform X1 [Phyllobates terribilis]|uniref:leucine-rich repeat-containing protein 20 isoform X1 n=1 Tax=Phyllobates terribilis TaxID=111132 RepID=UPI003CCA9F8B
MAEAVAKVARRVNKVVEDGENHLDLADCALSSFPTGLYFATSAVADKILSISLTNNQLKSLPGKFCTTFKQLQELNIDGNFLEKLPHEASLLCNLKIINLARNKLGTFPDELTEMQCIESINLEGNQIKGQVHGTTLHYLTQPSERERQFLKENIPIETLKCLPRLSSVNLKLNPINKDALNLSDIKFELLL